MLFLFILHTAGSDPFKGGRCHCINNMNMQFTLENDRFAWTQVPPEATHLKLHLNGCLVATVSAERRDLGWDDVNVAILGHLDEDVDAMLTAYNEENRIECVHQT